MEQNNKFEEAKKLYQTANDDQKYVLEKLFPKLVENKDERIRKLCIELIESSLINGICSKEERNECITWIEKQNKSVWKPSEKQMEVLKEAADKHWDIDGLDPLYTLYEDLKKFLE